MWDTEVVASVSPTPMNADFTEAVKADTTAQTTVVKRLRRGDIREDGKIFWAYGKRYTNGEWWKTPEQFAAEKAEYAKKKADLSAKKAALPIKLRRGDVRGDGMVFWTYGPGYPNGEWWMAPEQYAVEKARQAKKGADFSAKKASSPTKLRRGDTREDGMVFWCYSPNHANGERWMTPEQFTTEKVKTNARKRERRATDPLFALKCRLRTRVFKSLKRKGFKKNTKTAAMLGCSYEELKDYAEARLPPGMSWESFLSDGHLDHIVPLDAAKTEEDVYSLNHYTNLRPMWGPENLAKSAKLPAEHELPDNLHPKVREIWERAASNAPGTPNHQE